MYNLINKEKVNTMSENELRSKYLVVLLKDFIESQGVSSKQIAKELGVHSTTVDRWISGQAYPKGLSLDALEKFLSF